MSTPWEPTWQKGGRDFSVTVVWNSVNGLRNPYAGHFNRFPFCSMHVMTICRYRFVLAASSASCIPSQEICLDHVLEECAWWLYKIILLEPALVACHHLRHHRKRISSHWVFHCSGKLPDMVQPVIFAFRLCATLC